jgi:hypothetical protein
MTQSLILALPLLLLFLTPRRASRGEEELVEELVEEGKRSS